MPRIKVPGNRLYAALFIALAAAALLCGYEFIRNASQSLFIEAYGKNGLPTVMALAPVGTLLLVAGYARLLSVVGSERALLLTSAATAMAIAGCHAAILLNSRLATGVLYVIREAYIVLLVEQIWSFINSTLGEGEARKLNGPVCGIASLGAISGAKLVYLGARSLGTETLLLFAAFSLIPTGLFAVLAYRFGGEPQPAAEEAHGRMGHLGLRRFTQFPVLSHLAVLILLTQVVSTLLDLRFYGLVADAMPDKDVRTAFTGLFWFRVNVAAACGQFLVAPLVLQLVSIRLVHAAIPLLHVLAGVALLLRPSLWTGSLAFLLFKSIDYSVFRAAKEILYIPLPYDVRYRSKELIDAFGYRLGKGGMSGVLALATRCCGTLSGSVLAGVAVVAEGLWLPLVLIMTKSRPDTDTPRES